MNATDPVEIGRKMDCLGLWKSVMPYNWAVKPRGTVFPYFCTVVSIFFARHKHQHFSPLASS